jgi:gas vesicle protein
MNQETASTSTGPLLLAFLSGAVLGAAIAALTTPKSGPELRGDLKDAAARAKRKAAGLAQEAAASMDDLKGRGQLAASDLKRGFSDMLRDLKRPAPARDQGFAMADGRSKADTGNG